MDCLLSICNWDTIILERHRFVTTLAIAQIDLIRIYMRMEKFAFRCWEPGRARGRRFGRLPRICCRSLFLFKDWFWWMNLISMRLAMKSREVSWFFDFCSLLDKELYNRKYIFFNNLLELVNIARLSNAYWFAFKLENPSILKRKSISHESII